MHLNAFFDLTTHTYTDAVIQPVHSKNEFAAFCDIVDRHEILEGRKNSYIGDRGYCSYNNMAHVMEHNQYFCSVPRISIPRGWLVTSFFRMQILLTWMSQLLWFEAIQKKYHLPQALMYVLLIRYAAFDHIEYGVYDTYEPSFRIVRFPISDSTYECIVTNLPKGEFPPERIKCVYDSRWGIESSFRKLKYTIGLSDFHAYKPEYIKQEIRAKLITYNITETIINHTVLEKRDTKHAYKVNFTMAAHICRVFLHLATEKDQYDVMSLLQKEPIPIRNRRQYPRLQTAHFRKPRYFIYRAA